MGIVFGRLSGGLYIGRRPREDNVDFHADQLGCHFRQLLDPFRPAELNDNVLALDVAEVTQARAQRLHPGQVISSGGGTHEPDVRDFRLLRARRERPSCRAADKRDELAPLHGSPFGRQLHPTTSLNAPRVLHHSTIDR
jgi:hypothetical protein